MTEEQTALVQIDGEAELNLLKRKAELLSQSQFLPTHFQGKPADCLVAVQWAQRTGLDPLELLQNSFVVKGTPGVKSTYMIAAANRRGPFDGPIRFDFNGSGDDLAVTAWGLIDGERYERTVSMQNARDAKWTGNTKYKEIPEQMLAYRAATFLIRLYCPEVMCGLQTVDEIQDVGFAQAVTSAPAPVADLDAALRGVSPVQREAEDAEFTEKKASAPSEPDAEAQPPVQGSHPPTQDSEGSTGEVKQGTLGVEDDDVPPYDSVLWGDPA